MKNIFKAIIISVLSICTYSCSDYLDNDILDDQIYLAKSGLTNVDVFNWGVYSYNLPVIKSGKGSNSAIVVLSVDESILKEYNKKNGTSYKILPKNCYSLDDSELAWDKKDYRKFFSIDFNSDAINSLNLNNIDQTKYVLPCKIDVKNSSVALADSAKSNILICPSVTEPYIGFDVPLIYSTGADFSITTDNDDIQLIFPKVGVNYPNEIGISYQVLVDESVLNKYNQDHNTNLKMIPNNAYEIDQSSCFLRKDFISEYLKITLKEAAFKVDENNFKFGRYAIPLKLKSVSKYKINPDAETTIYPVNILAPTIAKTGWVIDTVSCEISDEIEHSTATDQGKNIFDGKNNTYWKTKWVTPDPFPYFAVIDLGERDKIYNISFTMPADSNLGNIKSGYIEVSLDKKDWKKIIEFSRPDEVTEREMEFDIKMTEARYFKFVITDAFEYANPELGKSSGARCALAEINLQGY
ncbi:MAG: DUF1735 domain-containing protein [Bacteroidales bacterium]|nr:DUF1735 domain-containing protein [Bacteroidales bacterium]